MIPLITIRQSRDTDLIAITGIHMLVRRLLDNRQSLIMLTLVSGVCPLRHWAQPMAIDFPTSAVNGLKWSHLEYLSREKAQTLDLNSHDNILTMSE